MRRRRRTIGLAALALALPLPAYALTQDAEPAGPVSLSVSASLDSCGVSNSQVICQINVSFEPIPNATSYTASITSIDGSVTDLGDVAPGGSTVYVPYVGNGTYNVRVSAYGSPPEPNGEPELLDSDTSGRPDPAADVEVDVEDESTQPRDAGLEVGLGGRPATPAPAGATQGGEVEVDAAASNCEPALVPVPELTPEEEADADADAYRVASGEPSTLEPELAEKVAAIEEAEAANAAAAKACQAP